VKHWLGGLVAAAILWCSTAHAETGAATGTLVIIGGALRYENAEVWTRIVKHAAEAKGAAETSERPAGYRPKIAVFPTASGDPQRTGKITADALNAYGADAYVVPLAFHKMDLDPRIAVSDRALVERVREADGVYFTGGSQARITQALRTETGEDTPMLQAVWDVYRRGGVVAGTSAGAAIMSHVMYRDAKRVLHTMQHGVSMGKEIDRGLGFLDAGWFVEQHTLVRGRFARALVAMQANEIQYGIGVDENTCVVVRHGDMEVVGQSGVIVMDMSEAALDAGVKEFNIKNVKLSYLDHGDCLCLSTMEVTPSTSKREGDLLDPKADDFAPDEEERLFSSDILGRTAAVDLMCKVMRHREGEALGLAFDAAAAQVGTALGFEFRFYRGDDTIGWCCSSRGDECYTVRNVRLDVRPIEIVGPLYK
jgi:cyanophycinase